VSVNIDAGGSGDRHFEIGTSNDRTSPHCLAALAQADPRAHDECGL